MLINFLLQMYSIESDVWAYGIVLWEIFSLGAVPYPGVEPGMPLLRMLVRGERLRCPDLAPGYAYDIMKGCWHENPSYRLPFDRIENLLIRYAMA